MTKSYPPFAARLNPPRVGLPDFDKRLQLLTLNEGSGAAFLVDGIEKRVADSYGCRSPTVAGKNVVGVESPTLRVVVQVPLDTQVLDRFEAQSRDQRGEISSGRSETQFRSESSVVSNTFLRPGMIAPPNVGFRKYFC